MPIHVPPPPQFFMNHHQQSLDGWKSPHSNTLEHNLKNKSHHNLIPFQNNLDTGNNVDFEPTCLMRTASGSLFIPNGMPSFELPLIICDSVNISKELLKPT